jgi:hypothetical protein
MTDARLLLIQVPSREREIWKGNYHGEGEIFIGGLACITSPLYFPSSHAERGKYSKEEEPGSKGWIPAYAGIVFNLNTLTRFHPHPVSSLDSM